MSTFILVLILCTVSSCLLVYGLSNARLWKEWIEIREPSIRDLEDTRDLSMVEQYVKEEIQTYHNYSKLKAEIEKFQDSSVSVLFIFSAPLTYCYTIAETIKNCFFDVSGFWAYVISIAITFVIVALPLKIVNKVFPSPIFDMTKQELFEDFEASGVSSNYPISESVAFNNFIRSRHHWFLYKIRNIEETRRVLKYIGLVLMAIAIYIAATN